MCMTLTAALYHTCVLHTVFQRLQCDAQNAAETLALPNTYNHLN